MSRRATEHISIRGELRGRGSALAVVTLLVSVLSVFSLAAVSYLLSSLKSDTESAAADRTLYVAELGRADAFAYVVRHPDGPWPHTRTLTTLLDDRNGQAGEYSYTITDLTLPEQNQRRLVHVHAYWPTQLDQARACELRLWLEQTDGAWRSVAWATGNCAVGG